MKRIPGTSIGTGTRWEAAVCQSGSWDHPRLLKRIPGTSIGMIRSMADMDTWNGIQVTEFIMVGFPSPYKVKIILFILFFIITFLMTVIANAVIITLICTNHHQQTPMYFFLCNFII
ncbi:hypothetical protein Y1Q_0020162 [Alligator mississippiensis]|uniref:G-protein coupled receptors family 1 profile domain-containing protein n=1 Tax=Alligator mississippiensis TaxID=8496 RepID=A0A151NTW0_ALLMI|nr:hypothetical protein Y1Q_0020162 [Alligator mississippiensis]